MPIPIAAWWIASAATSWYAGRAIAAQQAGDGNDATSDGEGGAPAGGWPTTDGTFDGPPLLPGEVRTSANQQIADGLKDIIAGVTGTRSRSYDDISSEVLRVKEINREARANILNNPFEGRKVAEENPATHHAYAYPQSFFTENHEPRGDLAEPMPNYIHFRSLERRNRVPGNEHVYDIFLAVPGELKDDIKADYEDSEKGLQEQIIGKLVGVFSGGDAGGPTDQGIGASLNQMWKDAAGGAVGKHVAGKVINPLKFKVFQGVSSRTFSYTFELYPENEKDSAHIRDICYAFKKSMLPGIVPGTGNKIYTFPNEWAIRFRGPIKNWVDYPMVCVLTGCNVDQAPHGNVRMMDGAPVGVKIGLTFDEVFQLDRVKFDQRVAAQTGNRREQSQEGGTLRDVVGTVDDGSDLFNQYTEPQTKEGDE